MAASTATRCQGWVSKVSLILLLMINRMYVTKGQLLTAERLGSAHTRCMTSSCCWFKSSESDRLAAAEARRGVFILADSLSRSSAAAECIPHGAAQQRGHNTWAFNQPASHSGNDPATLKALCGLCRPANNRDHSWCLAIAIRRPYKCWEGSAIVVLMVPYCKLHSIGHAL
jgi:hypothetical protein